MAFLPFDMDYLTEDMLRRSETELKEFPEICRKAVEEMKQLIKEDKTLCYPLDDGMLLPLLRVKKFEVKRAMSLLKHMMHYKENYEDVHGERNFDPIKKICFDKALIVLPYRDHNDGAIFVLIQLRYMNFEEMGPAVYLYAVKTISKWCNFLYPATQVCGLKLILDIEGLTRKHLRHLTPRMLYHIAENLNNGIVNRLRQYHIINHNAIFELIWNVVKHALSTKLRTRVRFHSNNLASLHSKIHPDLLPKSLGGNLTDEKECSWLKLLEKFEQCHYDLKQTSGLVHDKK